MKKLFRVKGAGKQLKKSAAELEKEFDRIIAEEDKRMLRVQCTSLEIENKKLLEKIQMLEAEKKSLAAENRRLQRELNQKRFDFALLFCNAQQLSAENLKLRAQAQIEVTTVVKEIIKND